MLGDRVQKSYEPLNRENVTLILIDLQVGPISTIKTMEQHELKQNAQALATVAQLFQLPTILASGSQTGPKGAYLPELLRLLSEHTFVRHSTTNAWPVLVPAVEQIGRKKLIIAGIATDVGVLFPVLSAQAHGYEVYVVTDVCGTLTMRSEQAAFSRMTQAGAVQTSWASLATEILQDFSGEHGMQILKLINEQLLFEGTG